MCSEERWLSLMDAVRSSVGTVPVVPSFSGPNPVSSSTLQGNCQLNKLSICTYVSPKEAEPLPMHCAKQDQDLFLQN